MRRTDHALLILAMDVELIADVLDAREPLALYRLERFVSRLGTGTLACSDLSDTCEPVFGQSDLIAHGWLPLKCASMLFTSFARSGSSALTAIFLSTRMAPVMAVLLSGFSYTSRFTWPTVAQASSEF
jgi:hypothetical protein